MPIDNSRTDDAVCGLGRPGQVSCSLPTMSENHTSSRPNDLPVAYSARNTTARTPTTVATPQPAHIRAREGCPDCTRTATPSAASRTALHGVICGQVGNTRVNPSTPVAQPTQAVAANTNTTATAARPLQASAALSRPSELVFSIDIPSKNIASNRGSNASGHVTGTTRDQPGLPAPGSRCSVGCCTSTNAPPKAACALTWRHRLGRPC
jgi:hypothetical protein